MQTQDALIHVVDDEADVRDAVAMLLRSVGLACVQYGSAQQFLAEYKPGRPGCLSGPSGTLDREH
jgi:FixJ family two-component response regulator